MTFTVQWDGAGGVKLSGRLSAAEADRALAALGEIDAPVTVDCSELEYISSAGIGVIMVTFKRLRKDGHPMTLVRMTPRVRNVFRFAGLDRVLRIE